MIARTLTSNAYRRASERVGGLPMGGMASHRPGLWLAEGVVSDRNSDSGLNRSQEYLRSSVAITTLPSKQGGNRTAALKASLCASGRRPACASVTFGLIPAVDPRGGPRMR